MTADQTAEPRPRGTRRALSPRLTECPIVVLRARNVVDLVAVCDALVEEGIRSLEFTLTTPEMLTAMPDMVERYAASADVGAGTVKTTQEAAQAIAAGADYLVTPTMNLAVVETAVAAGVAVIPGGLTPT
jgi:2-dehydro-3-deoxyphosphogluconate aldolase / (4S)-4-hydroxy-2-oxoglutarate aldolase